MRTLTFPRLAVLKALTEIAGSIAGTAFVDSRPSVTAERIERFAVVKLSSIKDRGDTYQTANPTVTFFARDRAGDTENVFGLQTMADAFTSQFPVSADGLTASRPRLVSSGADAGFHYVTLLITVTIDKNQ